MATQQLFGNKIPPACKYCMHGYPGAGDQILCARHGVTSLDHKCRHFYYDPLLRQPRRPQELEKFDQRDFSLDLDEDSGKSAAELD